jgi:hypothetical protein
MRDSGCIAAVVLALAAACSTRSSRATDPELVDPIAVELDAREEMRVEGVPTSWEGLAGTIQAVLARKPRPKGWSPAAEASVEPGAPPDSAQKLVDALARAGIREIDLVPWSRRRNP